ncbi:SemiSWEET family sugar transporter [Costertonia aggregata]|uniref:SemiSWEET transporter n=1 Tax=Costertonia aggregata TaxID=343403 RepID=A0A7H9AQH2_9FLAO|nr:SemiSWEET transporter [Costertonia aggregata]QLG45676.1 SemiSWEET transporter [Costertonia aggregata]
MDKIEILGLIAAALTTSSFVPQVYKAWKQKSTKDISLTMYLFFFTGIVLWLIYGIAIDSLSMIIANAITIVLSFFIIAAKLKYK